MAPVQGRTGCRACECRRSSSKGESVLQLVHGCRRSCRLVLLDATAPVARRARCCDRRRCSGRCGRILPVAHRQAHLKIRFPHRPIDPDRSGAASPSTDRAASRVSSLRCHRTARTRRRDAPWRLDPASNLPLMAVAQHPDRPPTGKPGHQLDDPVLRSAQRLVLAQAEDLVDTRSLVCDEAAPALPHRTARPAQRGRSASFLAQHRSLTRTRRTGRDPPHKPQRPPSRRGTHAGGGARYPPAYGTDRTRKHSRQPSTQSAQPDEPARGRGE